jgi:hypothetical protein
MSASNPQHLLPTSQVPSDEFVSLAPDRVIQVQRRLFGFREVVTKLQEVYKMGESSQVKAQELKAAAERGYVSGVRVVQDLCESPSCSPANALPVECHPNIPSLVRHVISTLMPPPVTTPRPLHLTTEYYAITKYIFDLEPRASVFVLGQFGSTDVLIDLTCCVYLAQKSEWEGRHPVSVTRRCYHYSRIQQVSSGCNRAYRRLVHGRHY